MTRVKPLVPQVADMRLRLAVSRDLTPEQNDRLRTIARQLLSTQSYNGNATKLAGDVKRSQSSMSKFLNGSQGAGYALAEAICRLAGRQVEEVLGTHATITLEDVDRRLGNIERLLVQLLANSPGTAGKPDTTLDESSKRPRHR